MKEMKVIKEQELLGANIRVYGTVENPLFLAKDVAEWIEYDLSSVNKMVALVDDEEKVRNIVPTLGGNQEMWLLTEDGLYEILMQSRKPIAKEFKKGVKEVLKSIRKTGGYVNESSAFVESYFSDLDENAKQFLVQTLDSKKKLLEENKAKQVRIEEMQPKEEFFDQVTDSKDAVDMATVAKVLNCGIGRNKLFEILRDEKVLMGNNQPYQRTLDSGYMRVVESKFTKPNGDICINFKTIVYQSGISFIRKILKRRNIC